MNLVIDCFKQVKGAGKSIGIYNLALSITRHLGERVQEQMKAQEESGRRAGGESGITKTSEENGMEAMGKGRAETAGENRTPSLCWEMHIIGKNSMCQALHLWKWTGIR